MSEPLINSAQRTTIMSHTNLNQRAIEALTTTSQEDASIDQWFANVRAKQANRDLRVANHIKVQADEAFSEALANGDDLD